MRPRLLLVSALLLLPAAPVRAGNPSTAIFIGNSREVLAGGPVCDLPGCPPGASGLAGDERLLADAAAAAGVSKEAFAVRLQRAAADAANAARAVALAQGLDAASAERYVAARVAAFVSAERRRLTAAASPQVRAAVGLSADEMGASASAGVLIVLGAITAVAGAARRLHGDPA